MGDYATVTHVNARIAHPGGFDTTTQPSSTQIDFWIDEGEAMVTGALVSIGGPSGTYTGNAAEIIRSWVLDYVEGHTRKSYAVADVDTLGNDGSGSSLLERFYDRLEDFTRRPAMYLSMLGVAAALDTGGSRLRSYVTDNADDRSVTNGDFDPVFKISDLKGNF